MMTFEQLGIALLLTGQESFERLGMKIREKVLAACVLACSVIATVSVQTLNLAISSYFDRVEKETIARRAKGVKSLMESDLARLKTAIFPMSNWGELRSALLSRVGLLDDDRAVRTFNHEKFFLEHFHLQEQLISGRTGTLIFDSGRNIVLATELAQDRNSIVSLNSDKRRRLLEAVTASDDSYFSGVVKFEPGQYAVVVSAPILGGFSSAKPLGAVVFFREFLDIDYYRLSELIGSDIHVEEDKISQIFLENSKIVQKS